MNRSVVLLSGGIDSTTTLAIAQAANLDTFALTIDYSQRHRLEIESSGRVAKAMGVREHLIIHANLRDIGGSALTSHIDIPKERYHSYSDVISHETGTIPVTYVPARNTIFLSFALAWAEVIRAEKIFIGANAIDYSGYPDCRPEYLKADEEMANRATKASVEGTLKFSIGSPILYMSKAEIIRKGTSLGVDYGLTWSCYDPTTEGKPCRQCDSCLFRAKGFHEAGLSDPLLG